MSCKSEGENASIKKCLLHRNSKSSCCVVGCYNAYYNTDLSVKFYSFPSKWYEKERKQIWINSVRKLFCDEDKRRQWQPKYYDKICSSHFVGGEKSNKFHSPSYNPTIFPENVSSRDKSRKGRFKRSKQVKSHSTSTSFLEQVNSNDCGEGLTEVEELKKKDILCQTDLNKDYIFRDIFTEHSYSLWKGTKIESKQNVQFEFVNCISETEFLDEEDTLPTTQDIIVKEELVEKKFENNSFFNIQDEKNMSLSNIYLSQVKKETEEGVEHSELKIEEEEIFIKDEPKEPESNPSTCFIKTEESDNRCDNVLTV